MTGGPIQLDQMDLQEVVSWVEAELTDRTYRPHDDSEPVDRLREAVGRAPGSRRLVEAILAEALQSRIRGASSWDMTDEFALALSHAARAVELLGGHELVDEELLERAVFAEWSRKVVVLHQVRHTVRQSLCRALLACRPSAETVRRILADEELRTLVPPSLDPGRTESSIPKHRVFAVVVLSVVAAAVALPLVAALYVVHKVSGD